MINQEIVMDYNCHIGYVDKGNRIVTVTQSAVRHGSGGKSVLPSVQSGRSEQLHPFFFGGGKKISQRFFNCPSEEHAGSGWTRTIARETCKKITHHFWNIARLINASISAGLVHPSWGDVLCALQHVIWKVCVKCLERVEHYV
jgi:hypothetical protein